MSSFLRLLPTPTPLKQIRNKWESLVGVSFVSRASN